MIAAATDSVRANEAWTNLLTARQGAQAFDTQTRCFCGLATLARAPADVLPFVYLSVLGPRQSGPLVAVPVAATLDREISASGAIISRHRTIGRSNNPIGKATKHVADLEIGATGTFAREISNLAP